MYGWRAKIGLIYPAPGITGEMEFHQMAPEGVAICTTRIPLEHTTPESLIKMADYIEEASALLSQAKVDVIAFCCTSGSLIKGFGYDKEIMQRIEKLTHIPAITTATSVIEGLKVMGMKKIVVATPYSDEVNQKERSFLESHSFEVQDIRGLGITNPLEMANVEPGIIYKLAKDMISDTTDGVFISCTGLGIINIIEILECDIQKPVITSNQATMWAALRKVKVREEIQGFGRLLQEFY